MSEANREASETVQENETFIEAEKDEEAHVQEKPEEQSKVPENVELSETKDQQYTSQSQRLMEAARAALVAAASLRDEQISAKVQNDSSEAAAKSAVGDAPVPQFARGSEELDSIVTKEQSNNPDIEPNVSNESTNSETQGNEYEQPQKTFVVEETNDIVDGQNETKETLPSNNSTLDSLCSIAAICSENNASSNSFVSSSPQLSESYSEKEKRRENSNSSDVKDSNTFVSYSKSSFNRPADSRVFIGNLASERTNVAELVSIFSKYGNLTEEPVIRRSFGFVQYDNAESAYRAIEAEQGRVIGGMPIDLSLADNRDSRRNSRIHSGVGPDRSRKGVSERFSPYEHSNRSNTTVKSGRHSKGNSHRPRRFDSRNGVAVRILVMGQHARGYAHSCEATIRAFLGLQTDVVYIEANKLGDSLELAKEQLLPYVIVVNSKDEREGSCSLRILDYEGYQKVKGGSLPFREVLNIIVEEEDLEQQVIMNMNALAPFGFPSGVDPTSAPNGNTRNNSGRSGNPRAARDSYQNLSQSSTTFTYPTYSNLSGNNQAWPMYGAVSNNPTSNISSFGLSGQPSSFVTLQNQSLNPQQQPVTQTLGYPQNQTNVGISNANPYASLLNSLSMLQQSQNSSQSGIPPSGQYSIPSLLSSGQQNMDLAKVANTLSSLSQFQQQPPPISRPSSYPQTAVSSGYNIANMLQSLQNSSTMPNVSSRNPSVSSQLPVSSSAAVPTNLLQLLQQAQAHVAMAQQQQQQSRPSQSRR